ncbi:LCP family protein [Bacillaceae bacterium IKA-2]|nr:LCP family protein [Bacillaceae bacterium IKA-2]
MSKKKKVLLTIGIIIAAIFISVVGYGFYLYSSVKSTVSDMHEPIERENRRVVEVDIQKKEPLSFLMLGVDTSGTEGGRTDTMMVITVNPNTESMKMLSIPRDTRTQMVGRGFDDKINHAYAFGGPEMAIASVENFLDIPIDYYITINMEGFKEIIDAFGGVNVDNPFAFTDGGHSFAEGEIFLDGKQALTYSRMRKKDPRGDHGRNDRQREIMDAVIKEGAQLSSITHIQEILTALGNNVRTDLDFDKMMKVQSNYKEARRSSEQVTIAGTGATIGGIWFYVVAEEERLRVSNLLKEQLEIE